MRNYSCLFAAQCGSFVFITSGRNDWQIRFTLPAIDGIRRVVFRSTGTKEIGAAKRIAGYHQIFWIDSGRSAVRPKLRDANATIGELIAKYKQRAAQRSGTIRSNVRSLRMGIKDCIENTGDDHYSTTEGNRGCHCPCG